MENSILRQIAFHYSLFPLSEVDARLLFDTVNPDDTTYGESSTFLFSRDVQDSALDVKSI